MILIDIQGRSGESSPDWWRESLQMSVKSPKRCRPSISSREVSKVRYPVHVWSYDVIFEWTGNGKTLQFLTIVDEFRRAALSLSCGCSLTGLHIIRTLQAVLPVWGVTDCLRSDNGSEFVVRQVKKWLLDHGISTHYVDPESPWQNSFIERLQQHLQNDFPEPLVFFDISGDESSHPAVARGSTMRFVHTDCPEYYRHSNSYGISVAINRFSTK